MLYFDSIDLLIGMAILAILLVILWRRKYSWPYLLFFSVFWVYLLFVVSVIVFPFPILNPGNMQIAFKPSVNLIPFYFGDCDQLPNLCFQEITGNILVTIPFGFGISFIARLKARDFLWLSIAVGFGFELVQLLLSFGVRSAFRSVDINDMIFNATGVLLGYGLFRLFARIYLSATWRFKAKLRGLFGYIYGVVSQARNQSSN